MVVVRGCAREGGGMGKEWGKCRSKTTQVVDYYGPPCPRCHNCMHVHEHIEIGPKQLKKAFFYSRWYYCANRKCPTKLVMPVKYKVWNTPEDNALRPGDDVVMDAVTDEADRPPWE